MLITATRRTAAKNKSKIIDHFYESCRL